MVSIRCLLVPSVLSLMVSVNSVNHQFAVKTVVDVIAVFVSVTSRVTVRTTPHRPSFDVILSGCLSGMPTCDQHYWRNDYTIGTLDVCRPVTHAHCTDVGMTYSVIVQCADCVVFPCQPTWLVVVLTFLLIDMPAHVSRVLTLSANKPCHTFG